MKKKTIFMLLLIFAVLSINLVPDDKELFMGVNAGVNTIKANVMFLLDSSGSMSEIIHYPKNGVDGIAGNADDGFDQKHNYSGKVYNFMLNLRESKLYPYLQIDNTHVKYIPNGCAFTQCLKVDGNWIKVRYGGRNSFSVGQWIFDMKNNARAKIEEIQNISGGGRFRLRLSHQGPGSRRIGTSTERDVNMFCGEDVRGVSGNTIVIDRVGYDLFLEGWWIVDDKTGAIAKIQSKDGAVSGGYQLTLSDKTGDFAVGNKVWVTEVLAGQQIKFLKEDPADTTSANVLLYGTKVNQGSVWYKNKYLSWLVYHAGALQLKAVSYFSKYGTFDTAVSPDNSPSNKDNSCGKTDTSGTLLKRKVWTRIQVLREVACQVAQDNYKKIKMGMFRFNGGDGGKWLSDLEDLDDTTGTKLQAFKAKAYSIPAGGSTPLAEALADIWRYYKPDSQAYENDNWTKKNYQFISSGAFSADTSPIDAWCQKNFVIIITDGEPTNDNFNNARWDGSMFKNTVKRLKEYEIDKDWDEWAADPNQNGWGSVWTSSKPYLDDVAYYMAHQDMFPDTLYPSWKHDQNIMTYTIGFAIDLPVLQNAAKYGLGLSFTASNFAKLSEKLNTVLADIDLKTKGFSSITAPRKTTTTGSEDNVSYVGYFMPSATQSLWKGHLKAYKIIEKWGYDKNDDGTISASEYTYTKRETCDIDAAKVNQLCESMVSLSKTASWDSADKFSSATTGRNLFYNKGTHIYNLDSLSSEDAAYRATVFNEATSVAETDAIEAKLGEHVLGDIFHSETTFLGGTSEGKLYKANINPKDCATNPAKCYSKFHESHKSRQGVIYVGTNDGIFHMINADIKTGGNELWGFVPDEVLPNVKKNYKTPVHHYTVDGNIKIDDIFYRNGSVNAWKSILCFGLRRGGNAYYTLDVTEVKNKPNLLWKFKDDKYSGQSFAKAKIVQMRLLNSSGDPENRWVVVLAGGFAFNDEDKNDSKGKSVFIVDASTGELIWMIGYDKGGLAESGTLIDTTPDTTDAKKHLTSSEYFNYSIPSAISTVDINNDGVIDSIYFGNKAGHLFKLNVANPDTDKWTTNILYNSEITQEQTRSISSINIPTVSSPERIDLTLNSALSTDYVGRNIIAMDSGKTTYASAVITKIEGAKVSVILTSDNTFSTSQDVYIKTWAPIYLRPAVAYDACYNLWVAFGTGDKDRPKTNPGKGKMIAIIDNGVYGITQSDITNLKTNATSPHDVNEDGLVWSQFENEEITTATMQGMYYEFDDDKEKLYDPDPIILPDEYLNPHLVFNTYRPDESTGGGSTDPCETNHDSIMSIYDIGIGMCGSTKLEVKVKKTGGRISGGGMLGGGGEYVEFIGEGHVGSIPPIVKTKKRKVGYPGKLIFWKEKKR